MNLNHAPPILQAVLAILFGISLPTVLAMATSTTGLTLSSGFATCAWTFVLGAALQFARYPQMATACFALAIVQLVMGLYLRHRLSEEDDALVAAASRASRGTSVPGELPALKIDVASAAEVVDFLSHRRHVHGIVVELAERIHDAFGFPRVVMSFVAEPAPHILVSVLVQHCDGCDVDFEERRAGLLAWWAEHPLSASGEVEVEVRSVASPAA